MRSCLKFATLAACVGLFAGTPAFAARQEEQPKSSKEKKEKTASPKKKDGKKGAADSQEKGKLSLPILKGHDAFGLKIPYFDTEGQLQMVFNIGRASRLDEQRVSMAEMQLETFDDSGKSEMMIDLPQSVLNIESGIITTTTTVTIKRSDFEITGQSMDFNTETKQGKLSGTVRMLIYDLKEIGAEPAKPEETTTR
jgi:hypothetical protein